MERILRKILIPSFQQFPQNPWHQNNFSKIHTSTSAKQKVQTRILLSIWISLNLLFVHKNFLSIWISLDLLFLHKNFFYLLGFLLTFFLLYKNFLSIWISLLKPSFCSHFQRQFLLPQLVSETGHKTAEIAAFVTNCQIK